MKSRKSVLLLAAAVVLIAVLAGVGAAFLEDRSPKELPVRTTGSDASASAPASAPATTEPDVDFSGTVELDGVRYRLNTSLQAILFLGVDDGGGFVPGVAPGEGRRADTIFLFLLDDQSKTTLFLNSGSQWLVPMRIPQESAISLLPGMVKKPGVPVCIPGQMALALRRSKS